MKILFVSMPSIHFTRWVENLKDTNYELYWFDVLNRGKIKELDTVVQFTDWKERKIKPIKGEYFLYKKLPKLHELVAPYLEKTANETLEEILLEIQPDIVHSFEMQGCSYPILKIMNKFNKIKWIYSCWGSDLYYYKNFKSHYSKIKNVLKRIDYLITDCERDYVIAKDLGFVNSFLGVIPGGAGFKIEELQSSKLPVSERKIILIKGYEHNFGRGLNVVKAIEQIDLITQKYEVVVFGAHNSVATYVKAKKLNFKVYSRHGLSHNEVLSLMGKSLLYIGNSISDGLPNSLLEAIVMGAFPIQSNPGGVTAEIIDNGINGLLINEPNNIELIRDLVLSVLNNFGFIDAAFNLNLKIAQDKLDYSINNKKSTDLYNEVINS
ncbi:glycosyltransferase [Flavobacterium sp. MMLR14_040]|uniref:glycosyltransferase n=1 Tax=Flavobacterium sp. MMLR14_040 TaxID=3093843 RepID=UPI00298FFF95|nr:glycosyltransferase [Flavobacterium sp. MMLR14_040]MDW8849244.1 glycosyltransferase [Flavobacterium sp. MMLR14_040]